MIAHFVSNLFSGLWLYITLAGAGLAIGAGAFIVGRFTGIMGAAVFGAVAVLAAYTAGVVDKANDMKIAQLEAQVELQKRQIAASEATKKVLNDTLADLNDTLEHNNQVILSMEEKLAKVDRPECDLPEEIFDDLKDLR